MTDAIDTEQAIDIEEILGRCRLFAKVDESRRHQLAAFSSTCHFAKGHLVFQQGDRCPGIYVVDSGLVRIFKSSPVGKEHVLHLIGPNQTFAEVAAIGGFDCPASAEAIAESHCILLPLEALRRAMAADHQLCLEMMTGLSYWVHHLTSLMEDLVLRDATGRVASYLLEADPEDHRRLKLPAAKRHIASHLNLTSEAFSRTFRRLLNAGLIVELENRWVELKDIEALKALAEGVAKPENLPR